MRTCMMQLSHTRCALVTGIVHRIFYCFVFLCPFFAMEGDNRPSENFSIIMHVEYIVREMRVSEHLLQLTRTIHDLPVFI